MESKSRPKHQKKLCLGQICIRQQEVKEAEIIISNRAKYGSFIYIIGAVMICEGFYNILISIFGKSPNTLLFFTIFFFVLSLILGAIMGGSENNE